MVDEKSWQPSHLVNKRSFIRRSSPKKLSSTLASIRLQTGVFVIVWECSECHLQITEQQNEQAVLWENIPGKAFISTAIGQASVSESRGFFRIKEKKKGASQCQTLDTISEESESVELSGFLDINSEIRWTMKLTGLDERQLRIEIGVGSSSVNRIQLCFGTNSNEKFFGFGEQLSRLNMKGARIPVLSQEPGIGRGVQPLTWLMNSLFGAGGSWYNSSAPAPYFISTNNRAFCLENTP